MGRASRSQSNAVRNLAFAAGACTVVAAVAAAMMGGAVACITTPPPDLPKLPLVRPTIWTQGVSPAPGLIVEWPTDGSFLVPVQVATPGETFVYNAFLDSNPVPGLNPAPQAATDGGNALVSFTVGVPDTAVCPHTLEFIVASEFADLERRTPNAVGGDVANWYYSNGGPGGPSGCPPLDAGSGAPPDAAPDALPVPPEAGGDP
jgi:hypothetical protein